MQKLTSTYSWGARAITAFATCALVFSCGGTPPPAGTSETDSSVERIDANALMSCGQPSEGCACEATQPLDCYLEAGHPNADELLCHRGTRYCREGTWSGCESVQDYTLNTTGALITGPSPCNPCDPSCYNVALTPTPTDLNGMNSTNAVYDPGTGGISIVAMTGSTRGTPCMPITSCPAAVTCGSISNGCGGSIVCGTCATGTTCGGGGVAGRCGTSVGMCTPRGCGTATCGPVADGCGNLTASCGSCPATQGCGGSGVPSQCGNPPPPPCVGPGGPGTGLCTAVPTCTGTVRTTTITGIVTAPGHANTCASYTTNASCSADTTNGCSWTRGPGPCVSPCASSTNAVTCALHPVSQGCSWSSSRGQCRSNCRNHTGDDACNADTALGCSWPGGSCSSSASFGAPDPLFGVHVFVPGTTPPAFTAGVSCDSCSAGLAGNPIAQATTDVDGNFAITGVPCGTNIPLVIQLGRWRRQVVIPSVSCCASTAVPAALTHMPRNHTEGDIPLIAMVTGDVDVMECVLRKMGIDDTEFSNPAAQGGTGRVRFYSANGSDIDGSTPGQTQLVGSSGDLNQYDMAFFACEGDRYSQTQANQQRLVNYANAGGRIFATHYSYVWLTNNPSADPAAPTAPAPFSQTAAWSVDTSSRTSTTATIDTSFPRGATFAQWLYNRGASTTLGRVGVNVIRQDFSSVNAPAQRWLYDSTQPIHYTFDTPIAYPPAAPVSPANQCGRVVFSDFHVEDFSGAHSYDFPDECTNGPLTAQERVLEYMLFDLASCITPTPCTPRTCAQQGATCGPVADGCGGSIASCGACVAPDTCGGGGVASQCGHPTTTCTPLTCAAMGLTCGSSGDGCGGSLSCTCTSFAATATYTQLYSSTPPCAINECPIWGTFTYTANVPAGTHITFGFQSAQSATGFPSPPTATLTVNPPMTGTVVSGSADITSLLLAAGAPSNRYFLNLTTTLYANSALTSAPTLQADNATFTCVPCE